MNARLHDRPSARPPAEAGAPAALEIAKADATCSARRSRMLSGARHCVNVYCDRQHQSMCRYSWVHRLEQWPWRTRGPVQDLDGETPALRRRPASPPRCKICWSCSRTSTGLKATAICAFRLPKNSPHSLMRSSVSGRYKSARQRSSSARASMSFKKSNDCTGSGLVRQVRVKQGRS